MLYIIAAPSGAGKTSLVRAAASHIDHLSISVSFTTRPPRPGEIEGVNYHFVTPDIFEQRINQQDFLEYAQVFGYFYGTSRKWVNTQIQNGNDVILEIDWQGAFQIRKLFPQSVSIFILPPSLEILHARLKERKQDSENIIEKRMAEAKSQCAHFSEFEYLIINNEFNAAVAEFAAIVQANRLRCAIQRKKYAALIQEMLI
jgi:guanylate kinase